MGAGATQFFGDQNLKDIDANNTQIGNWVIMEGGGKDNHDSESMESSYEDSENSIVSSSSSSDFIEDASSSSTSSSSSSSSNGPLYELSELMAQLPIKRGLSKYYQGKSQSYTSLASVKSIEDLAKKVTTTTTYKKKRMIKSCKSYGGSLDGQNKFYTTPKATISKKNTTTSSRGSSFLSLLGSNSRGTLMTSCKPPYPVQQNF